MACLVSLGYPGSTEEMEPRATVGPREPPVKLDLRALNGPKVLKENRIPRPLRETGNNMRGRTLVMGETVG